MPNENNGEFFGKIKKGEHKLNVPKNKLKNIYLLYTLDNVS